MQKVDHHLRFNDRKELGRGARSTVYEGMYGSLSVAVKRILCSDKADIKETREADIMYKLEKLRHENIVGFYYRVVSDAYLYIAMELCQGTLKDYIKSDNLKDNFPPLKVNISMANGLQYLHSQDVVHRDLKPENIFFVSKGHDNIQRIVLGDFGTSKCTVEDMLSVTGNLGSSGYIPYELCDMIEKQKLYEIPRSNISTKSDIFALGCLFYYTYTGGKHPFGSLNGRQSNIGKASTPSLEHLEDHLQPCREMLTNMLSHTPEQRPNATDVVTHPALWMPEKIVSFFTYASNSAWNMYKNNPVSIGMLEVTHVIPNENWINRLPTHLPNFLGRRKARNDSSVVSLLRAFRNLAQHYEDLSEDVKMELGRFPDGYAQFWMKGCPKLLMHVHRFFTENVKDMPTEYQIASSVSKGACNNVQGNHSVKVALPYEILRLDKHSIEIYKQILKEGEEAVHNIRVMVVGHVGVGKTALTKRLLGKKIDVSTRESTNGIEVHVRRCNVSLKDGQWTVLQKDEYLKDICKRLVQLFADQRVTNTTYNQQDLQDTDDTAPELTQAKSPDTGDTALELTQAKVFDNVNITDIEDATGDNDTQTDTEEIILNDLQEINKVASTSNLKDEQEFARLSIWDFAGHHAFYSTHQVFLSHRAVYLLVTDISKNITDLVYEDTCCVDSSGSKTCSVSEFIEFWLNSIHGYCPTTQRDVPPVILIGTHADLLDKTRKDKLSEDYFLGVRKFLSGKVIECHVVDDEFPIDNSIDDPTLDGLKKKILEVASKQSYWGELIPARWIMLEKALMGLMRDEGLKIIERVEIESINRLLPVPMSSDEELQLFLRFQHDLGNILYFSDEGLRDYVLLDPQWLIDAFKCILTAERFCSKNQIYEKWQEFNKTGKLKLDLIDAVWKKEETKNFYDNRHHLLGLMEKLDIIAKPRTFNDDCSETEDVGYFFAPSALKDPPPPDILISHPKYQSTYKLCFTVSTNFIPTAIFNRLFAACLTRWQISRQEKKDLIFCGCGVFDVDDVPHPSHRLTLYFKEHVIQIWVTRYSETHPPSSTICANVKEFVEQTLRKIIDRTCQSSKLEMFIKCPKIGVRSGFLYKLSDLWESEEIPCHCNQDSHVLATSEMFRYWFTEKSIQSAGGESGYQGADDQPETPGCTSEQGNRKQPGDRKRKRIRRKLPVLPNKLSHRYLIKTSLKRNLIRMKEEMNPAEILDLFCEKAMFEEGNHIRDIQDEKTISERNGAIIKLVLRQPLEILELFKDCLFESDTTGSLIKDLELAEDNIIEEYRA